MPTWNSLGRVTLDAPGVTGLTGYSCAPDNLRRCVDFSHCPFLQEDIWQESEVMTEVGGHEEVLGVLGCYKKPRCLGISGFGKVWF